MNNVTFTHDDVFEHCLCWLPTALYPPVITNITCLTGVVEVHYKFDSTANAKFSFDQKNYFFHGGCRDEKNQEIYRVRMKKCRIKKKQIMKWYHCGVK